jgi:RNA polymerase sigma-70 factor (ECF subfamily)
MTDSAAQQAEAAIRAHCLAGRTAEAVTLAMHQFGPELFGVLMGTLRDEDAAGEVFSMFSEDLLRALPRFEWRAAFRNWAYTLARHACSRYLRDPYRRRGQRLETDQLSELAAQVQSRTLSLFGTEVKDAVQKLREALTPEERMLLILHTDRGIPLKSVAEILSENAEPVSYVALRKRFERLKEKIRRLAAEQGIRGRSPG